MSSADAVGGHADGVDEPDGDSLSSTSLFDGDEGGLEMDQRRALVMLLKQRFISGRTHPQEWRALTRNPRPVRARLNDLFLDLHLDLEREVAYKRQVTPEAGRAFPTLLHDLPWGREDSVLLVFLRSRLRSEQAAGSGRAFIDRQDMLEHLERLRPSHATDQSGDARRATKAIESLFSAGLLLGRSDGDRFEISNAVEVLLPVDRLQQLLSWLRDRGGSVPADVPDGALGAEDDDEEDAS